jgi:septal ring factor EnvC (AmiA/AmiB activator)
MSETRSGGQAEQRLEHTAEELDHELHRLEDHITDARKKAEERREEAIPGEAVAGDWEDTRGTPSQGEDPTGAVDADDARHD